MVQGDPLRLKQLLGVLLDNATRYSRRGGRVWVTVAHDAEDARQTGRVHLAVHDEGIGIPDSELPMVFDRHFRGTLARQHCTDGSGLGLGIARALAQAHGGTLSVRSQPVGACVVLSLPLAPAIGREPDAP